jgi:hypothetical protein
VTAAKQSEVRTLLFEIISVAGKISAPSILLCPAPPPGALFCSAPRPRRPRAPANPGIGRLGTRSYMPRRTSWSYSVAREVLPCSQGHQSQQHSWASCWRGGGGPSGAGRGTSLPGRKSSITALIYVSSRLLTSPDSVWNRVIVSRRADCGLSTAVVCDVTGLLLLIETFV